MYYKEVNSYKVLFVIIFFYCNEMDVLMYRKLVSRIIPELLFYLNVTGYAVQL